MLIYYLYEVPIGSGVGKLLCSWCGVVEINGGPGCGAAAEDDLAICVATRLKDLR
jgi:hypothetical protein